LAQQQLLAWAAVIWPDRPPQHVPAIAARVAHQRDLAARLLDFDRALFQDDTELHYDPTLLNALNRVRTAPNAAEQQVSVEVLPSLGAAWHTARRPED
ncbi:MAG: hypothetical protein AAF499_16810, partial [Pseudomonadota bacterium]